MIKKVIKESVKYVRKVFIPKSEFIDDVDQLEAPPAECGPSHFSHGYSPYGNVKPENKYVGVVAPIIAPFDSWFSKPVKTEKAIIHEEKVAEQKKVEATQQPVSKEPENIHQKMYEMATKSGSTTLQLNPIGGSENFQGGSENFHER